MTILDGIRLLWCLYAPWHRWVKQEQIGHLDVATCSCGRVYKLNHRTKTVAEAAAEGQYDAIGWRPGRD